MSFEKSFIPVWIVLGVMIAMSFAQSLKAWDENGNVACGESASWNEIMSNNDNSMDLGDYQVAIELTNGGTPVQANWNYRFEINYNF